MSLSDTEYQIQDLWLFLVMAGKTMSVHVLATVSSAAMSTGVHISVQFRGFVFSRYAPGMELLDHIVDLFLVF